MDNMDTKIKATIFQKEFSTNPSGDDTQTISNIFIHDFEIVIRIGCSNERSYKKELIVVRSTLKEELEPYVINFDGNIAEAFNVKDIEVPIFFARQCLELCKAKETVERLTVFLKEVSVCFLDKYKQV